MALSINDNGTWKTVKNLSVNNGTWRDVKSGWINVNGIWKEFYKKIQGKFIYLPATSGNIIYFSDDGISWSSRTLPATQTWRGLGYNSTSNAIVVVSPTNSAVSFDGGQTWSNGGAFYANAVTSDVCSGNGVLASVGGLPTSLCGAGAYSNNNGSSWAQTSLPTSSNACNYGSVTFGAGRFVAVSTGRAASTTSTAAYSDDGINWAASTMPYSQWFVQTRYYNNRFVAISYRVSGAAGNDNGIAYSNNGINWTASTRPGYSTIPGPQSMAFGNNRWIVLDSTMKALYSDDNGQTFSLIPSTTTTSLYTGGTRAFVYGSGKFVIIVNNISTAGYSATDQILTSTDGFTWISTPASFKTTGSGKLYFFESLN